MGKMSIHFGLSGGAWAAAILLGLAGLPGCSKEPPVTGLRPGPKVRLVFNWLPEPEFGGIYAAQELGLFQKHGLNVELISGGPGVPTLDMTAQGQADFGVGAADEVVLARCQGRKLTAVFAAFQTNPQAIMAHESRGFKSLEDVLHAPGSLAVQTGLSYVAFLQKKYDPITATMVAYDGGIELFMTKPDYSQQCFAFSEPLAVKQNGEKPKVFLISESDFNPYSGVVLTSDAYAQSHTQTVHEMAAALREGWQAYLDNPKPINAAIARLNTQMREPMLSDSTQAIKPFLESDDTKVHGLGAMTAERWQILIGQLVSLNLVKPAAAPKAKECFVALPEAARAATTPTQH